MSSWRTFQLSLLEDSTEFSETWPRSGSMQSGIAYQHQPLAPLISGTESGLLPTPVANDVKGGVVAHLRNKNGWDQAQRTRITSLAVLARNGFQQPTEEQLQEAFETAAETERAERSNWPTPHGMPKEGQPRNPGPSGNELGRAVNEEERKYPTPMAADSERTSEQGVRHYKDGTDNPTLLGAARRAEDEDRPLMPTPTASDGKGSRRATARTEEWTSKEGETLLDAVELERWPTPTVQDSANNGGPSQFDRNSLPLNAAVKLWPTPRASNDSGEHTTYRRTPSQAPAGEHGRYLQAEVIEEEIEAGRIDPADLPTKKKNVPTPRASDGDPRNRGDLIAHAKERPNSHHPGERTPERAAERRPGGLNPTWVEWLMGFPLGWTALLPSETPSSPKSPRS